MLLQNSCYCFDLVPATGAALNVSESSVKEGTSVTFTCTTFSNPRPRLRLFRRRQGEQAIKVKTAMGVTLSWTYIVESDDNKARFHCRVDDNKNIDGWDFEKRSEIEMLIVWCMYLSYLHF